MAFQHLGRRFGHGGRDGRHCAVVVVGYVVEARHVAAADLGDVTQLRLAIQVGRGARADDLQQHLFALADDEHVDEGAMGSGL